MIPQAFPHIPAESAASLAADDRLKCWFWNSIENTWKSVPSLCWVAWIPDIRYHVGHEPPHEPPQRRCRLAGLSYPMPLDREPSPGAVCFLVEPGDRAPMRLSWGEDDAMGKAWLASGQLQATEAGAIEQGRAMRAALQQAVSLAR